MTSVRIIAEIGSVHDGSFGNALKLIEAAKRSGANAVKFQTHIASAETLPNAPMPAYFKGEPRYSYFERTSFSLEQWTELKHHCDALDVDFMSSPFSIEAVELLDSINMACWKIPSGEITNLPMLEVIAQTGKPIIISSGMSSWAELDAAVEAITKTNGQISILQCTSAYPCSYMDVGMNVMVEMKERYQVPVGLSDHTLTIFAPIVAVTLGAEIVEKHFTFSRLMYGSDAQHSLEPNEFEQMVEGIRAAEIMLGTKTDKDAIATRMREMKEVFEKSVVAIVDIPAEALITADMVALKKPGTGIPARCLNDVIGARTRQFVPKDTVLQEAYLYA